MAENEEKNIGGKDETNSRLVEQQETLDGQAIDEQLTPYDDISSEARHDTATAQTDTEPSIKDLQDKYDELQSSSSSKLNVDKKNNDGNTANQEEEREADFISDELAEQMAKFDEQIETSLNEFKAEASKTEGEAISDSDTEGEGEGEGEGEQNTQKEDAKISASSHDRNSGEQSIEKQNPFLRPTNPLDQFEQEASENNKTEQGVTAPDGTKNPRNLSLTQEGEQGIIEGNPFNTLWESMKNDDDTSKKAAKSNIDDNSTDEGVTDLIDLKSVDSSKASHNDEGETDLIENAPSPSKASNNGLYSIGNSSEIPYLGDDEETPSETSSQNQDKEFDKSTADNTDWLTELDLDSNGFPVVNEKFNQRSDQDSPWNNFDNPKANEEFNPEPDQGSPLVNFESLEANVDIPVLTKEQLDQSKEEQEPISFGSAEFNPTEEGMPTIDSFDSQQNDEIQEEKVEIQEHTSEDDVWQNYSWEDDDSQQRLSEAQKQTEDENTIDYDYTTSFDEGTTAAVVEKGFGNEDSFIGNSDSEEEETEQNNQLQEPAIVKDVEDQFHHATYYHDGRNSPIVVETVNEFSSDEDEEDSIAVTIPEEAEQNDVPENESKERTTEVKESTVNEDYEQQNVVKESATVKAEDENSSVHSFTTAGVVKAPDSKTTSDSDEQHNQKEDIVTANETEEKAATAKNYLPEGGKKFTKPHTKYKPHEIRKMRINRLEKQHIKNLEERGIKKNKL